MRQGKSAVAVLLLLLFAGLVQAQEPPSLTEAQQIQQLRVELLQAKEQLLNAQIEVIGLRQCLITPECLQAKFALLEEAQHLSANQTPPAPAVKPPQ